jgi:HAMP domain-containing protein
MKDQSTNRTLKTSKGSPHALEYQPLLPRVVSRRPYVRWILAILAAIGLIAAAWRMTQLRQRLHLGGFQQPSPTLQVPGDNVTAFYRSEISPLLDAALQRDRQAAARAIDALHERFDVHRAGVRPFAEDVSGWRTRFGVIGCFATDQWDHDVRGNKVTSHVADYIQAKFRVHVLSEQALQADLEDVLKQYRGDMEANRNQLFAEIKLPLEGSQSPIVLDDAGWDGLYSDIVERVRQLNAHTPRDNVVTGLVSVAGGWVGTEAGEVLAAGILTRIGSTLAVEAASGSATLGGTTTGGEVGSLAGPAGTAIGIGAGLAVGAAVDWWASNRLEAHVIDQSDKFLDTVEDEIVDGGQKVPGLRASFEQAAKVTDQNQRQAILDALLEARK